MNTQNNDDCYDPIHEIPLLYHLHIIPFNNYRLSIKFQVIIRNLYLVGVGTYGKYPRCNL